MSSGNQGELLMKEVHSL
jgi:hypothetical protein